MDTSLIPPTTLRVNTLSSPKAFMWVFAFFLFCGYCYLIFTKLIFSLYIKKIIHNSKEKVTQQRERKTWVVIFHTL